MNEANDSKFVTRKWNILNDHSKANYNATNEIVYNTEILKSNLLDYYDSCILVRGDITVTAAPQTQVVFKNCAPFTKCISKTNGTSINNAENLDLVMQTYNLIKYSSNYSEITGIYGFILKTKQLVLMHILQTLMILNLANIRLNY